MSWFFLNDNVTDNSCLCHQHANLPIRAKIDITLVELEISLKSKVYF